jgi:hypothetical protein
MRFLDDPGNIIVTALTAAALTVSGFALGYKWHDDPPKAHVAEHATQYVLPKCQEDDLPVVIWQDKEWVVYCWPADDPR